MNLIQVNELIATFERDLIKDPSDQSTINCLNFYKDAREKLIVRINNAIDTGLRSL